MKPIRRYLAWAAQTRTLIGSGLAMAFLMLFAFPALPGIGTDLIDLLPAYSHAEVMAKLASYGPEGRRLYAIASPTLDTLFPIAYVTFFAGAIHRLRRDLWLLACIPLLLGVWDLCENAQITAMLLSYPDVSETQAASASFFTMVKHWLTRATLGITLVLGIWNLVQYLSGRPARDG